MVTSDHRKQLDEQGFVLVPGFTPTTVVNDLNEQLERLFHLEGEAAGSEFKQELYCRRLSNLLDKGEIFRRLAAQSSVLEFIQTVLGEDYKLSSMNARSANPRQPVGQPLHADMAAVPDEAGFWVCNVIWLVDDFTETNGCLRVVPGSHQEGKLPQDSMPDPTASHPHEVLVTGERGSLIVFNAHLWHSGTANRTDNPRTALHGFYCRGDKPQQQYQKELIDPQLQETFSAGLRQLLALDDPRNDRLAQQDFQRSGFLK